MQAWVQAGAGGGLGSEALAAAMRRSFLRFQSSCTQRTRSFFPVLFPVPIRVLFSGLTGSLENKICPAKMSSLIESVQ